MRISTKASAKRLAPPSGYANRPILDDGDDYIEGRFKGSRFFDGYDYGPIGYGMPGEGGNGTGLNGVYYDWVSGTYRNVYDPGSSLGFSYAYHGAIVPSGGLFNLFNKDADGTCTGIEYSKGTLYISSGDKWVGNSITYNFNTGVYNKIPYDNRPNIETAWWGMGYHMDDVLGLGFGEFKKIPWSSNHNSNATQIANFLHYANSNYLEIVTINDIFTSLNNGNASNSGVGQYPTIKATIRFNNKSIDVLYGMGHRLWTSQYSGKSVLLANHGDTGIGYHYRYAQNVKGQKSTVYYFGRFDDFQFSISNSAPYFSEFINYLFGN